MSLSNLTIAVTGSRRANELAHIIKSFGGKPYIAPTIGIEITEPSAEKGKQFIMKILREKPDYVVFMTGMIMNVSRYLVILIGLVHPTTAECLLLNT